MKLSPKELEDAIHYTEKVAGMMGLSHEYADLVGEGMLGLVQAKKTYKKRKGTTFVQYASWRIRGAMIDYLRRRNGAGRTRLSNDKTKDIRMMSFSDRVDDTVKGQSEKTLGEILGEDGFVESFTLADSVKDALDPREWVVVKAKYFDNGHVRDAMGSLGLSEAQVSQLHRQALVKLEPVLGTL